MSDSNEDWDVLLAQVRKMKKLAAQYGVPVILTSQQPSPRVHRTCRLSEADAVLGSMLLIVDSNYMISTAEPESDCDAARED